MDKIKGLVIALRSGRTSIWDLHPLEFEKLLFHGAINFIFKTNIEGATYQKSKYGGIDYIIDIPPDSFGMSETNPGGTYFIECKYYRGNFVLNNSAKAFCAAIKYQPKILLILSPIDLSPQLKVYAEYFFGENGIYRTRFIQCRLEELLKIRGLENRLSKSSVSQDKILREDLGTEISIKYWKLVEEKIFSHCEVINSENSKSQIEIDSRIDYSLKIWIKGFHNTKAQKVKLMAKSDSIIDELELQQYKKLNSGGEYLQFKLKPVLNIADIDVHYLLMTFKNSSKKVSIKLPQIKVRKTKKIILQDFREKESRDFIDELLKPNSPNLIFLHGEGGIGKTYLCERIAKALSKIDSYRAHLISTSEDTNEGIFYKLIWPVISPERENIPDQLNDNDKEILSAVIEREIEKVDGFNNEDVFQLIENITNLKLSNVNIEALTYLCSRLLLRSPNPQMVIISNCHELSPGVIKGFKHLIMSLDDKDWGKIKFVFEYRDTKEDFNEEWESFVSNMKTYIRGKIKSKKLSPLTRSQISAVLNKTFTGNDGKRLTTMIMAKASGNPLFIFQLLYLFVEKNYIVPVSNIHLKASLNVLDFRGIEKELDVIPEKIDEFLKRRVEFYIDKYIEEDKFRSNIIAYLSIASLIGDIVDEERIKNTFHWNNEKIYNLRSFLIEEGFIQPDLASDSIKFIHQIMRLSILDVIKSKIDFSKNLIYMLSRLNITILEDAIIGGKAHFMLKDYKRSFEWYNSAYEMSFNYSAYLQQRICLLGCKKNLDQYPLLDETLSRKRIGILFRLGKVELQVGSQIDSLKIFDHLLDEINLLKETSILHLNELHSNTIKVYKNKMTIHHRFLDPKAGLKVFLEAISEAKTNQDIQNLIGRFVILCFESNFPRIALNVIQIHRCIPFVESNYEEFASHLSNLGHVYVQAKPLFTCKAWNKSVELAQSEREKTHATLNSFVGELYANKKFSSIEKIDDLESRIKHQGVENQMILLSLYKGVLYLDKDKPGEAKFHFGIGLRKSQQNSIKFLEWECHNNIAIIYLMEGQTELSLRHFEKALLIIKATVDFYFENHHEIFEASDIVLQKVQQLNPPQNSFPFFDELPEDTPLISGNHHALLHNVFQLSDDNEFFRLRKYFDSESTGETLWSSQYFENYYLYNLEKHPLIVHLNGKRLILAL
jgi:tetratricopeptide (TPR) repeat protein